MCTNRALVNSLECYMDDLVECFEDFVQKSIIVISVAVGVLIVMIAYVLKTIVDRPQSSPAIGDLTCSSSRKIRDPKLAGSNFTFVGSKDNKGTSTATGSYADTQNLEEKLLKDPGLTGCSKVNCGMSITRIPIPSLRLDCKKSFNTAKLSQKLSKDDGKALSCCSMCCDNNCDR